MKYYVLVMKNSEYINDCDDGYHYNNPTTIKADLYVCDYLEHTPYIEYAKKYKSRKAAENFKKKLCGYMQDPIKSEYYDAEIIEIKL